MSTRLDDWEARLAAYLDSAMQRPHIYGDHDCALHGAAVVQAVTGADHGTPFRGRYTTGLGAARALRRFGAGTLDATFDAHLPRIAPSMAQRGDLVLAEGSIGVCVGGEALFVGEDGGVAGLVRLPRVAWTTAWRV